MASAAAGVASALHRTSSNLGLQPPGAGSAASTTSSGSSQTAPAGEAPAGAGAATRPAARGAAGNGQLPSRFGGGTEGAAIKPGSCEIEPAGDGDDAPSAAAVAVPSGDGAGSSGSGLIGGWWSWLASQPGSSDTQQHEQQQEGGQPAARQPSRPFDWEVDCRSFSQQLRSSYPAGVPAAAGGRVDGPAGITRPAQQSSHGGASSSRHAAASAPPPSGSQLGAWLVASLPAPVQRIVGASMGDAPSLRLTPEQSDALALRWQRSLGLAAMQVWVGGACALVVVCVGGGAALPWRLLA